MNRIGLLFLILLFPLSGICALVGGQCEPWTELGTNVAPPGWHAVVASSLIRELMNKNDDYYYLTRGVAPKEARYAVEGKPGGRVPGRVYYGIQDQAVTPAYVLNPKVAGFPAMTRPMFHDLFQGMRYYADQGAAAERAAADGKTVTPWRAQELYPDAKGRVLIFRVSKKTRLEKKSEETFAAVPERVVALPADAELIAVLPSPPRRTDKPTDSAGYEQTASGEVSDRFAPQP